LVKGQNTLQVYSLDTSADVDVMEVTCDDTRIKSFAISSSGHWLTCAGDDGSVWLWRVSEAGPKTYGRIGYIRRENSVLLISPDEKRLFAMNSTGPISCWRLDESPLRQITRPVTSYHTFMESFGFTFDHDGKWLASVADAVTLLPIDESAPSSPRILIGPIGYPEYLSFSLDDQMLMVCTSGREGGVRIYDLSKENFSLPTLALHDYISPPFCGSFSSDGRRAVVRNRGFPEIRVHDLNANELVRRVRKVAGRTLRKGERQWLLSYSQRNTGRGKVRDEERNDGAPSVGNDPDQVIMSRMRDGVFRHDPTVVEKRPTLPLDNIAMEIDRRILDANELERTKLSAVKAGDWGAVTRCCQTMVKLYPWSARHWIEAAYAHYGAGEVWKYLDLLRRVKTGFSLVADADRSSWLLFGLVTLPETQDDASYLQGLVDKMQTSTALRQSPVVSATLFRVGRWEDALHHIANRPAAAKDERDDFVAAIVYLSQGQVTQGAAAFDRGIQTVRNISKLDSGADSNGSFSNTTTIEGRAEIGFPHWPVSKSMSRRRND